MPERKRWPRQPQPAGSNLRLCHRLVNCDLPWNPMLIEQRIGRLHRIGRKHPVEVFNLCRAGGVEDYILEILDNKINLFEMVIGEIDMIRGRSRGEQEISDWVLDIWVKAADTEERGRFFSQLGSTVKRLKSGYEKSRALDVAGDKRLCIHSGAGAKLQPGTGA